MIPAARSFSGRVDALEIARGHDGLFRGKPDPVLVVGTYWFDGAMVRTFGRSIHRFDVHANAPTLSRPDSAAFPSCTLPAGGGDAFYVVAIAIEENDADGVTSLYGAVERPQHLSVSPIEKTEVDCFPLAALPRSREWSIPVSVQLLVGGGHASALCRSDTLVGAVVFWLPARPMAMASSYRLPFVSDDKKNDWTALVTIAH
jgi:hypothetical protein